MYVLLIEVFWSCHYTPAFDIAYSYKPDLPWVNSHQLSLNGKRDNFVRNDLLLPAEKFRKEAEAIIEEVIDVVAQWPKYTKEAGVFPEFAQEIQSHHRLKFL